MPPFDLTLPQHRIFLQRLIIGTAQGLILFAFYLLHDAKLWSDPFTFLPLTLMALFLPLVAIGGLGHVAPRALVLWIAGVAAVIVTVSLSAAYRLDAVKVDDGEFGQLIATIVVALFIAHTLFVARQVDGRWLASYTTSFELAWKHALQIIAGALFVAAFWALYMLGAALFSLLKIDALERLVMDGRFIPITAVVTAVALHMTDVRGGIIAGLRSLALTLLSWLLPLLTLIVAAFLLVLPFAGFDLLWDTRSATALLLAAAAALIVLINAVYQNGAGDHTPPAVLKVAASIAVVLLTPLTLIAGYGLALRVVQYGWTADRIIAAASILIAAGYAVGYLRAVIVRGAWLHGVERANVVMAYTAVAVLIALFTPIADPARISVASQIDRLKEGRIAPEEFDVTYLRFGAGRYGVNALNALKDDPAIDTALKERAVAALARTQRFGASDPRVRPDAAALALNIEALPRGKGLPESFRTQTWTDLEVEQYSRLPDCLTDNQAACHALIIDLDRDGEDEVIISRAAKGSVADVFKLTDGSWQIAGKMSGEFTCPDALAALRKGEGVATAPSPWDDVVVVQRRIAFQALEGAPGCD